MEHYDGDIQEQFEEWLFNEGYNGNLAMQLNHLDEDKIKRICEISWLNGAYCAEQNLVQSQKKFKKDFCSDCKFLHSCPVTITTLTTQCSWRIKR